MGHFVTAKEITTTHALLSYYFEINALGPAPFPSYLYRRSLAQTVRLDFQEAGKYSDVTFLLKLLQCGPLIWPPLVGMQTRIHANNDSRIENIGERMRLLRFVCVHYNIPRKGELATSFRYRIWARWWLQRPVRSLKWPSKQKMASLKFLLLTSPRMLLNIHVWHRLYRRLLS